MSEAGRGLPPGYRLIRFETIDSTMSEAERQAIAGAADGTLILADEQTAGRGRRGRQWATPPGNLALSLLLRPQAPLQEVALLSFVAGLALHDSLSAEPGLAGRLTLKWPNDLLLDGAKLSGLLLESRSDPDGWPEWLIIGMGVNLAWAPQDTPYPATALADALSESPSTEQIVEAWAWAFDRRRRAFQAGGFAALRPDWKAAAQGLGGPLTARLSDGTVLEGRFEDLGEDGNLLLALPGETRPRAISAGDIYFPKGARHASCH
ncbi:MAG: biotin--[acetyl-CoA-carboxylase] ligase [Kiloniellales bacterium]